jgi:hypothetical protein
VSTRDLSVGIVGIQIDIRKNAIVRVPPANSRVVVCKPKLGTRDITPFDDKNSMRRIRTRSARRRPNRFWRIRIERGDT